MSSFISEEDVEQYALDVLSGLGYERAYGPDISEGGLHPERKYDEVVLLERLRRAIDRRLTNLILKFLRRQRKRQSRRF